MKLSLKGIDWKNQTIAFIATILGVIIGLQLQDMQDEKKTLQRLNQTIGNLNSELSNNLASIDSVIKSNDRWQIYLNFLIGKKVENQEILLRNHELDSIQVLLPEYFTPNEETMNLEVIKVINDTLKLYKISYYDFFRKPDVSIDNWEATKESGVLLTMNPDQIIYYTKVYKLIESLNDHNVMKYYWAVRDADPRKYNELGEANNDVSSFQIQLMICSDGIHNLISTNRVSQ